jgi:sortase A
MLARRQRRRKFASYLLMAAGLVLFFLGARVVVESRLGQDEAEQEFESSASAKPSPFLFGMKSKAHFSVGDTVAKLTIPRLGAEFYVVEGDGERELRLGPGHVAGTPMPGQGGNCIIAGHRDTHFRVLKDIRKGDDIVLQTGSGEFTYRVQSTEIVMPSNRASLKPSQDSRLHLVTCYPFHYLGSAPKRFIVEAELLQTGDRIDTTSYHSPASHQRASNASPHLIDQLP